jgi:chemotaxis protein MotB
MPRLRNIIGIGIVALGLTGCVPAEQYQGMKMQADRLAEQLGHSQSETNTAIARAEAAERQLASMGSGDQSKVAIINSQAQTIADLTQQNNDLNQKYLIAIGNKAVDPAAPVSEPLGHDLSTKLHEFATQYPDMVDFDASRGIVKFKSDVTFAPGDATVSAGAKDVIHRFASILASANAGGYQLMVAGHTDNRPITSKTALEHGHFNNWYLSAHRAIAVETELGKDGVSAKNMGVIGYADEHPVASNSTETGRTANRRVEVLILPETFSSTPLAIDETPSAPRLTTKKKAPVTADKAVTAASRMDGGK